MINKKLFSRRNFVRSGIVAATGLGFIGKAPDYGANCPVDTLEAPAPYLLTTFWLITYRKLKC